MDIGIDTLVYMILGVVFVLVEFLRKRKIEEGKVPEPGLRPVVKKAVPPVYTEPASFQRIDPGSFSPVHPESSLTDMHDLAESYPACLAKPPDDEQVASRFNLRSAVIQSVILECKFF